MTHRIGDGRWHRRPGITGVPRLGLRWVAGGVLLGLASVGMPKGVFAAGVVGTGRPESCTEAALDAALVGGGRVAFNCGASPFTFTLTTSRTIEVDTSLDGGGLITLSGGGTVEVLVVNAGTTLDLANLTIANGQGDGAIDNGGRLTATRCTFSGNYGGAIYNDHGGFVTVTSSTFSGNSAAYGGGAIFNVGMLTVTNSGFSGNSFHCELWSSGCGGGAIENWGMLTVTTSNFSGNTFTAHAGVGGGAIENWAMLTVTSCTFSGNSAPEGHGGAISNDGTLNVTNSMFSANSASGTVFGYGGAIGNNNGVLTVTDSTFSSNTAGFFGGAIGNNAIGNNNGVLTVTDSTFSSNTAGFSGGAIDNNADTLIVTSSTFSSNSANRGGALHNVGTLAATDSTFSRNSATEGNGGAIDNSSGTLIVTNSTFSGNSATGGGGAIYADLENSGTLLVTNTIVANSTNGGDCVNTGAVIDGGHNLIGDAAHACGLTTLVGVDPMLDPAGLKDNGGPTQTIALLPNSPAINAGDADVCSTAPVNGIDQRGYVRPGTGSANCSIGAFEYNSPGPPPSCAGDCNHDGAVTITELVSMVNIALGTANVSACTAGDANGDGAITINEIITAVNHALDGCPAPVVCGGIAGLPCPTGEVCDRRDPTCAVADLAGTCVPGPSPCPSGGDPVCGCDGVTYANDCIRVDAGATLAHVGACAGGP